MTCRQAPSRMGPWGMTVLAVLGGTVALVAVAGLARDRLLGRRRPEQPNGLGVDDPTLRYYRDVHDQQNPTWGGFGQRPL